MLRSSAKYKRILIQDSTIIKLPSRLFEIFSGVSNGHSKVCNARIQGTYDILAEQLIGVSRGLSQMVGYKVPWVMGLVAVMVQYQTTSITGLLEVQSTSGTWLMFSTPFAFIAALFAFIGMMHYSPFDIVFAPQELASGPPSEFGGKYLGLMMTSGAIFAFAKLTLFVDIFLGGASNLIELLIDPGAL